LGCSVENGLWGSKNRIRAMHSEAIRGIPLFNRAHSASQPLKKQAWHCWSTMIGRDSKKEIHTDVA
jgi:hypothetical protein